MPRERKGLVRKSGGQSKDPYVIFVIAAEGSDTESLYFRQIKSLLEHLQLGRLVKVEPLERPALLNKAGKPEKDTRSDAEAVLELLDSYRDKYGIKEGDELWCVIDRDRWLTRNIAAAAQRCRQKDYEFCMTTPCFELWLLLHLCDLNNFSTADQTALLANRRDSPGNRTRVEHELNEAMKAQGLGAYKKNSLPNFAPRVPSAVRQAFDLCLEKEHWQENRFCTRLHLLLQRIFKLESPHYGLPKR
jgi:hypothetical protein